VIEDAEQNLSFASALVGGALVAGVEPVDHDIQVITEQIERIRQLRCR